jgi:hypothetical protein
MAELAWTREAAVWAMKGAIGFSRRAVWVGFLAQVEVVEGAVVFVFVSCLFFFPL